MILYKQLAVRLACVYDCVSSLAVLGCQSNEECSHQQSCVNGACQNPCHVANPCDPHHTCQVEHHNPICIKGNKTNLHCHEIYLRIINLTK